MTALDQVKSSRGWNAKFDLPLFWPGMQNPWIYLGYARLVLKLNGEEIDREKLGAYYAACMKEVGLIYRWPGVCHEVTSHDEILGAASLDHEFARAILNYLDRNWGSYNVQGSFSWNPFRYNVYRMLWLRPYLKAAALNPKKRVTILDQLLWSSRLIYGALFEMDTSRHGPKPRLMNWLMYEHMQVYPICRRAWRFWIKRLAEVKATLSGDLAQEPDDVPRGREAVLSQIAPDEWKI